MKIFRIWSKGQVTSGGFSEHYDEPTTEVYTTYEKAKEHLPKNYYESGGNYCDYYIKEETIE